MLRINNKKAAILYNCLPMAGITVLFALLFLMLPYVGYSEYNIFFFMIFICFSILMLKKIMYGIYLDIQAFSEYIVIGEFYLFRSVEYREKRLLEIPYVDLKSFYIDKKKDLLFFVVNIEDDYIQSITFSSKYLNNKDQIRLENFLQQHKIMNNEKMGKSELQQNIPGFVKDKFSG